MKEILQKIEQFKNITEKDKIGMILSYFADFGCSDGGLISVKQFDDLADTFIQFKNEGVVQDLKSMLEADTYSELKQAVSDLINELEEAD